MSLLVDTSVWSLALRRNSPPDIAPVAELRRAIAAGETIVVTGLILQELLQGFSGPRAGDQIIARFAALPLLTPQRSDHVDAAQLRNACRRGGLQIGTIDALLAQLCIRHDLTMLSTDKDFTAIAERSPLKLWRG